MAADTYEPFEPFCEDHRPVPITPFERTLSTFLDELWLAYPVHASQVGDHRFDYRWPDLSGTGRLARLALIGRWRTAFESLDDRRLTADERIDRRILVEVLDTFRFEEEVLREETWDPLSYVSLIGTGLFGLVGREYAPWHHRGTAFAVRLRHLPEVLDAARENLLGMPDRPVSRLHTETAIQQIDGIPELIDRAIAIADEYRFDEDAHPVPAKLAAVEGPAREALASFKAFLQDEVMARSSGEGRLGRELFDQKLRFTLGSDLSREELEARATRDMELVRAEMLRIARELWPAWVPGEAMPEAIDGATDEERRRVGDAIVRRVLDAIAEDHRRPEEKLEYCTREVARIERFVRRNQMIGLPREPLEVTWTPAFLRAYGGAFLSAPGPLEKGQKSLFWITPPGDDWPPERIESYMREDNDRMLRLLCIHEAIPGHYLQLSWANRSTSLARSVFSSGPFVEGWAVYITQVMMDVGYGRRDPALLLTHWKFYLRAVINTLLDIGIHAGAMTERDAMALMTETGYQEEQEAAAKWLRARLTATQLTTYYAGSQEMWDLEIEARRRAAVAAGASASDVHASRLVGHLDDTPGFDYREHLEAVISHGMPTIGWVRRILFGLTGTELPDLTA